MFNFNFPEFVSIDLKGQTFHAFVVPYVDGAFKQVRFNIYAVDGVKTEKIRWSEKITAFENALKLTNSKEWEEFHK